MVDLDSGSLLRGCGDESRILPKKLQKALTVALSDDSGQCSFFIMVGEMKNRSNTFGQF